MKFEFPKLYTDFAEYYDSLEGQYRDYELEARWIASKLAGKDARKVIDISCGTARHVLGLTKEGGGYFDLVAMDASREMTRVAKSKLEGSTAEILRADFLSPPFKEERFDAAICMYWSIAGLDEDLTKQLFVMTNRLLRPGGTFIFDTENLDGIKEDLIGAPFIDAFFQDKDSAVIRANFSSKKERDLVDWHSYYLIETGGVSRLIEDRMNLRFYSKGQLERLLQESGFETREVLSAGLKVYEQKSPTLYFVAEKKI